MCDCMNCASCTTTRQHGRLAAEHRAAETEAKMLYRARKTWRKRRTTRKTWSSLKLTRSFQGNQQTACFNYLVFFCNTQLIGSWFICQKVDVCCRRNFLRQLDTVQPWGQPLGSTVTALNPNRLHPSGSRVFGRVPQRHLLPPQKTFMVLLFCGNSTVIRLLRVLFTWGK